MLESRSPARVVAAARAAAAGHHQQGESLGGGPPRAAGAAALLRPREALAQRRRVEHARLARLCSWAGGGVGGADGSGDVDAARAGRQRAEFPRRRAVADLSAGAGAVLHGLGGDGNRLGLRRDGRGARSQLCGARGSSHHRGGAVAERADRERFTRSRCFHLRRARARCCWRRACSPCCWRRTAACRSTIPTRIWS